MCIRDSLWRRFTLTTSANCPGVEREIDLYWWLWKRFLSFVGYVLSAIPLRRLPCRRWTLISFRILASLNTWSQITLPVSALIRFAISVFLTASDTVPYPLITLNPHWQNAEKEWLRYCERLWTQLEETTENRRSLMDWISSL